MIQSEMNEFDHKIYMKYMNISCIIIILNLKW